MYDRILVPVDGSAPATAALDRALDIAAEHGARVDAINVADTNVPSQTRIGVDVIDALVEEGATIVDEARERGEKRDIPMVTEVIQGDPTEIIVDYADTYDCELIVMGSRGQQTLSEYVLGTVTDQVVNRSDRQVLTVRAAEGSTTTYPYETILVPTDGSDQATDAVELGAKIAAHHDAALHLLFVAADQPLGIDTRSAAATDQREADGKAILQSAVDHIADAGVDDSAIEITTAVEFGSVRSEITASASDKGIDCIVMGTHGRTGFDQHLLGSTTERVLRTTPVPVLTIGSRES